MVSGGRRAGSELRSADHDGQAGRGSVRRSTVGSRRSRTRSTTCGACSTRWAAIEPWSWSVPMRVRWGSCSRRRIPIGSPGWSAAKDGHARSPTPDESIDAEGPRTEFMRELLDLCRREWGTGGFLSITVDGAPDEQTLRSAAARWERSVATPRRAEERFWMFGYTDVRSVLPLVSCPTLMVHNRGDFGYPPELGSLRRRARRQRDLRRAAVRQDLLVDRRRRTRRARPRRAVRARRARRGLGTGATTVDDRAVHRHRRLDPELHAKPATTPGDGS